MGTIQLVVYLSTMPSLAASSVRGDNNHSHSITHSGFLDIAWSIHDFVGYNIHSLLA